MNKFYFLLLLFTVPFLLFSQEEDESCLPPSKKVLKTLEKAKKSDIQQAASLFREAIDLDPDNATAYYEFGLYAYERGLLLYERDPDPRQGDQNMKIAENYFQKTIEKCSDFHSDCYYYLGVINYGFGNKKQATSYFKKFQAFDSDDVDKFAADHDQRLRDVAEVIALEKEDQAYLEDPVPFEPKIVKNVSTPRDEYFPMISPDNELMFYTRKVDRSGKGELTSNIREEFTWSKRAGIDYPFDGGKPLEHPFNDGSFDSYGASTLSVDNKEMIICACKDERVQGQIYRNCDLYVTFYERTGQGGNDYVWSPLENLGTSINTNDGWEGQPSLSADGNTLYFAANRPTTQNDDIFYSKRLPDGTWGPAKPFTEVNTPGKDKSPFFHQDSETFYFVSSVSKGRKGVGGTDIYYIRRGEDGKWSEPKNIGYPINTPEDEIGIYVSIDGEVAYFSSYQRGRWDIFSFELYEEARPKSVVVVKGEITPPEDGNVENLELEISYANSDEVEKIRVNGNDGKYAAIVKTEEAQDVMVNVKKDGYAFDSKLITEEELAEGKTIRDKNMDIKEIKVDEPYTINDILYLTASHELSDRAKFILKQFARFLQENKNIKVLIQGHTDDEGNPQSNLELSDRRANSVKDYLVSIGIDSNRLKAKGYGQTQPKVPNTSAANKQKNRRTDFVIQSM